MPDRRTALKVVSGGALAVGGAAVATPSLGRVAGPAVTTPRPERPGAHPAGAGADEAGWYRVAELSALRPGEPFQATVRGDEVDAWSVAPDRRLGAVWLLREAGDAVRALSAECPHVGCQIERAERVFRCPCHVSDFDLQGRCLTGPSPRAMDPLDVRVRDGGVFVRFVRYRLGTAAREVL